jgi:hypothetical protein
MEREITKGTKDHPGLLPMIIKNLPKKKNLEVSVFDCQNNFLTDHIAKHKTKLFKFRLQEDKRTNVIRATVKDQRELTYIFKTVFNYRKNTNLGSNHNLVIQLKLSQKKSFNFIDFCSFEKENLDKFGFLKMLLEESLGKGDGNDVLSKVLFRGSSGVFRFFLINHLINVEDKETIMKLIKFLTSSDI